jgi:hypothetical protein
MDPADINSANFGVSSAEISGLVGCFLSVMLIIRITVYCQHIICP